MKRTRQFTWACAILLSAALPLQTQAQDFLTGDTRLACEAILCLASASPPNECAASLERYFSISFRDFSDTARARANFLNLCPRANPTLQSQSASVTPAASSARLADTANSSTPAPIVSNDKTGQSK